MALVRELFGLEAEEVPAQPAPTQADPAEAEPLAEVRELRPR